MNSRHRVVVVGASVAGLTVAESLRAEGFDGEILLLGDEPHLPYSRPPLSKQVLLQEWHPERAAFKTGKELDDLGIEFRGSSTATGLDVPGRSVLTTSGREPYDDVVIATGARSHRVWDAAGVRTLRTLDDALRLREELRRSHRVAVLGAGVLGSEIASAGRALGADVTLIGRSGAVSFGAVGTALSPQLEELHAKNGVRLRLTSTVAGVTRSADGFRLRLDGDEIVRSDSVVAAIGGSPCVEWLAGSGLILDDGVVCDHRGAAAAGVHAVGDVAAWTDPVTGTAARVEHQTSAIEQAIAVARSIVHDRASAQPVPFFWSEIHGTRIKAYGWFAEHQPLARREVSEEDERLLFASQDGDRVRGVVAWNLLPRDFRAARALVDAGAPASPIRQ